MSQTTDPEFDLEQLFLPAWAKQPATSGNKYASFSGEDARPRRSDRGFGDRGGPRGPRRDARGPGGPGGPRREGDRRGGPRPGGPRGDRRDDRGPRREERREPAPQLPDLVVSLTPEEKGVEGLAKQIRLTGRSYPLFEIAQLVVRKPERYHVQLSVVKKPDGAVAQPLFLCTLDDTVWLSEAEVAGHLLQRHFDTFYSTEKIAGEPPKGTYTFVAQCGMSGVLLGPPNYHGYQDKLRQLHTERFSRMPFDVFKSRVKIVKDEAVVKQWIEEQSCKTVYTALNVPEPLKFNSREEVEKHFRETHLPNLVRPVESHTVAGVASRALPCQPLRNLVRVALEDQSKFPLKVANVLSQQFAGQGLQFFKVNKVVTHVCVARPHFLDLETTPVSDNIRRIIEFINAHPRGTRRLLLDTLAPAPAKPAAPPLPKAEGEAAAAPEEPQTTPEQQAVIADLHWLVHQGHVIEFANGVLETAKKPLPRPQKPERKTAPATAPAAEATAPVESAANESSAPAEPSAVVSTEAPQGSSSVDAAPVADAPASSEPPPVQPATNSETSSTPNP